MTEPWNAVAPPGRPPAAGAAATVVLALVGAYKVLLSPLFTGSCRFDPSCADYMAEAVRVHGAWGGVRLGVRRLARCHPLGGYGIDPVPGLRRTPRGGNIGSGIAEDPWPGPRPGTGTNGT